MGRHAERDRSGSLFPELDLPPRESGPARAGIFADVALNRPVRRQFTYSVPVGLSTSVRPGVRVAVPFSRRREVGVVVGLSDSSELPVDKVLSVARVLDPEPIVDRDLLELTRWMANEYACSWGEALAAVLPGTLKREHEPRKVRIVSAAPNVDDAALEELERRYPKQHRLLRTLLDIGAPIELVDVLRQTGLSDSPVRSLEKKELVRVEWVEPTFVDLSGSDIERRRPLELSLGQRWAIKTACERVDAHEYEAFLLQGVTGSGKTEVYLQVIEHALAAGRGAIVLVPEIALTPQTVGWFRSRFGDVAVLHSRMTDAQRLRMWKSVERGERRVVVGARSAVFAPVSELGAIVLDEEHEPSFKQSNAPRYHAREVALQRARRANAVCFLGSATPSLESFHAAREGRFKHLVLPERVGGSALPPVEVVDLRSEKHGKATRGVEMFSKPLRDMLAETLAAGDQSILFLNRRGYAPVLWCRDCRETVRCSRCASSMSLHRKIKRLVCHLCCEELVVPEACPMCTSPQIGMVGGGSERVEASLARFLPEARIRRMDSDTMHRREDYEETLEAFGRREIDVLVGTQMIAKGLDFPGVTLVGIVSADTALHLPDFRASERTFQLVEQVAGRAGRGTRPGRILVQTLAPDQPAIALAAEHRYEDFAKGELELRRELGYPPFSRLVRVIVEGQDEKAVTEEAERVAAAMRAAAHGTFQVLGSAPAPLARIRGRHRHHVLAKCPADVGLGKARDCAAGLVKAGARLRVSVDVDPASVM